MYLCPINGDAEPIPPEWSGKGPPHVKKLKNMSLVAIVGRPNVGKSPLFNRLVGERKAIVDATAGTTRDRHYGKTDWNGREFSVIDTGGYTVNSDDIFEEEIRRQVLLAIGLPHEIAHGSLRLTLGEQNTEEDVDYLIDTVAQVVSTLRSMSPVWENGKPNLTAASELHEH